MAFCSNCGGKLEEGVKFCSGCGSQVGSASVSINQDKAVNIIQAQPTALPTVPQNQSTIMADEKYCFSCGSVIKKAAEICPKCGVNQSKREATTAIDVFCTSCGKTVKKEASTCPFCGVSQGITTLVMKDKKGAAIASLVLGINSVWAWFIPLIGFPVSVVGILMGIVGLKSSKKRLALAGLILAVIGFVATTVNSAIGAYQGATSQLLGTVTITGIPSVYSGKYAAGEGFLDSTTGQIEFLLADNINIETGVITASQIRNGVTTLKVWKIESNGNIAIFTESGEGIIDDLLFFNDPYDFSNDIGGGDGVITFINGSGTAILNYW